ncbi:NAD-dependent epimerase/dehydratase family protein [Cupriavidus basilensis]|uniref:NAD-dependent epimerase/dehydratase family protein n=1 Tax=Cupriavidus basilensis TaxID=68895 RepID=UPI0020A66FC7|nr:NAD(P)-dependent oxidoreductase [Cupriavidus basilensis]MCP3022930.1 NAD(P)-dependent oxidoreductase [Cupriavidus basilensis]
MKRVLITGGSGFLGAWIIRRLTARGTDVRVFDIHANRGTVAGIAGPAAHELEWQVSDIRDADAVRLAMQGCDGVIHLAGILTPDCSAHPVRGAEINLIGSLNIFEAAHAHGIGQVVYASSAGVYGPHDARHPLPATHYGAFKLAVEGAARAYWDERHIASIGFRPFVVYGPGRETGVSAGPSLACRAAARGEACTIGYTGASGLIYVDDVAQAFEQALLAPAQGAGVYNLVGQSTTMDEVMAEIRRQVPGAQLKAEGPPLTIAPCITEDGLDALLPLRLRTGLAQGIAATLDHYRKQDRPAYPST